MIATFDLETCLIRPALQCPPPVCLALCLDAANDPGTLYPTDEIPDVAGEILTFEQIWGHNIAYDMACLFEWYPDLRDAILEAYQDGRVFDTMIQERLGEIGQWTTRKVLSLDVLGQAYGLPGLDKDSGVRLSYGPLLGQPLARYTPEQVAYPLADVVTTARVAYRQGLRFAGKVSLDDVATQTRKAFWLACTRARGLRVHPRKLETLRAAVIANVDRLRGLAQGEGFIRPDGSKDMKAIRAAVEAAYAPGPAPRTDPSPRNPNGQVATSRSVLEESGDPVLETFAEYAENAVLFDPRKPEKGTLAALEKGVEWPLHTKWGIADTTRTTSSKPNLQNIRRAVGIRECFIPRDGYVFLACDYAQLELCTLAQVIATNLRLRGMADKINAGIDLHCDVAAEILGITYPEALQRKAAGTISQERQCGKVVNFGRPGGMGAKTLRFYGKQSYDLDLTVDFCKSLIVHWEAANPDGRAYLDWISRMPEDAQGRRTVRIPGTGIIRRGCTYPSAANTHFQALGAVVAGAAGWEVLRATLAGSGPLASSRMVHFVHDEFILETPPAALDAAARALREIMVSAARPFLPDVQIDAEAVGMRYWSKKAKPCHDGSGALIPWGDLEA